jgi:hypothetical protein
VLAQLLDAGTTIAAMELGGYEKNPIMSWLLQYGYAPFVVFKLVLAAALGFVALTTKYLVWVLLVIYFYVIANNIEVLTHLS